MSWQESASVLIQDNNETLNLKYPGVTICPKVSTKYAIAERLANFMDPMNLPKELLELRHDFLICAAGLNDGMEAFYLKKYYDSNCIKKRIHACKVRICLKLHSELSYDNFAVLLRVLLFISFLFLNFSMEKFFTPMRKLRNGMLIYFVN